jgi:hypothetical protein
MTWIHVAGIVLFLVGPLAIWPFFRKSVHASETCRNVVNFHLTMLVAFVPVVVAFELRTLWVFLFAFAVGIAFGVMRIVFGVLGAIQSSRGNVYRYPLSIPFISSRARPPA